MNAIEQAKQALEEMTSLVKQRYSKDDADVWHEVLKAEAALAALSSVDAQPVAWMRNNRQECITAESKRHMESADWGHWNEVAASYTIPLVYASLVPQAAQPELKPPEPVNQDLAFVEMAAAQSTIGHLSQRVDEAVALATEAVELMTRFHSHAEPDDTPDMNAVFPALHFRNFVDDHARLMFKLNSFVRYPVDTAFWPKRASPLIR